jgi:hypothetical protein
MIEINPLGHRDCIRDAGVHRWRRSAVAVRELPGCENGRGDQQNALATLVQPYLRYHHLVRSALYTLSSVPVARSQAHAAAAPSCALQQS